MDAIANRHQTPLQTDANRLRRKSNRSLITRAQSRQWFDRGNVRAEIRESLGWCRRPRMNLRCVATRSSKYRGRTAKNQ